MKRLHTRLFCAILRRFDYECDGVFEGGEVAKTPDPADTFSENSLEIRKGNLNR
jgi:hypothetical protein